MAYVKEMLKKLNSQQRAAVEAPRGIARVIALAGSGKTSCLTAKIAYEVQKGMNPSKILALTFTKKAGSELRLRLRALIGDKADSLFAGTFHSFAHQQLVKVSHYSLITDNDIYDIIKTLVEDKFGDNMPYPMGDLHGLISYHRNSQKPYEDPIMKRLEVEFKQFKMKNNLKDYDDLLEDFLLLLEKNLFKINPDFILCDEAQDCNTVQNAILKALMKQQTSPNIFVIGDGNQSIYGFRAADLVAFNSWDKLGCKDFPLAINYRSTGEVLKVANRILKIIPNGPNVELIAIRNEENAPKAKLVKVANGFDEVSYIVKKILELKQQGKDYSSMAVVYRAHFISQTLQLKLTEMQIPYTVWSGQNLLTANHIQDVICFLRAYTNPKDVVAWARIFRLLPRVGKVSAHKFAETTISKGINGVVNPTLDPIQMIFRSTSPKMFLNEVQNFYLPIVRDAHPDTPKDMAVTKFLDFARSHTDLKKFVSDIIFSESAEKEAAGVTLTSIHQCVAGDTFVETEDGLMEIENIKETGLITTPTGIKKYKGKFKREPSEVLTLTTKSGYSVTVTLDHGMTTWNGNEWIRLNASKLKLGNFLRLRVGTDLDVKIHPSLALPLHGHPSENTNFSIPSELNENLGELLGLLVADGVILDNFFRISKHYESTIDRAVVLCNSLFLKTPVKWRIRNVDAWAMEFDSTFICRWLHSEFNGLRPHLKGIPSKILQSPISVQAAFLRGLFEDGTINLKKGKVDHICLYQKKPEIITAVQRMLLRMGIISTISLNKAYKKLSDGSDALGSYLYIYGSSIKIFTKIVGFVSKEKQSVLESNPHGTDQNRKHFVEKPSLGDRDKFPTVFDYQNAKARGYLSRHKISAINPADLIWLHEEIVSIEKGIQETFCVEVPEGSRFLQNGFDGWNSKGLEWDTVFVMGIYDGVFPSYRAEDPDEELRLYYVAVTRAKTNLFCTFPEMTGKNQPAKHKFFDILVK